MKTINLSELIKTEDRKEIAEQLFPDHKYPLLAFQRVASGKSELDAKQIKKLSLILETSIDEIFRIDEWKKEINSKGEFKMQKGNYVVILNQENNTAKIYDRDSFILEEIIYSTAITLNEYVKFINSIINKIEKSKNHESKRSN